MDIVLHHIHPWMQRSIAEVEDRNRKEDGPKYRAADHGGPPLLGCIRVAGSRAAVPYSEFANSTGCCGEFHSTLGYHTGGSRA